MQDEKMKIAKLFPSESGTLVWKYKTLETPLDLKNTEVHQVQKLFPDFCKLCLDRLWTVKGGGWCDIVMVHCAKYTYSKHCVPLVVDRNKKNEQFMRLIKKANKEE